MPKKKLTKKQVNTKVRRLNALLYDLMLDKIGYGVESNISRNLSKKKLMEMQEYTLPSRVLR